MRVYFCDPHSPRQSCTCENTNGLLRQMLSKGMDLSVHDQAVLDSIADLLNNRPRQTLNWLRPQSIELLNMAGCCNSDLRPPRMSSSVEWVECGVFVLRRAHGFETRVTPSASAAQFRAHDWACRGQSA
jgi:hypothetical protein